MAHATTLWHGRRVCSHMVPKLNLWESRTPSFYVRNINGSYTTGVSLSANTHGRGGAMDAEGDGKTAATLRTASNLARSCILLAWPRFWAGNWHIHVLDPSCSDLSSAARTQFVLFGRGYDGLVGNHPDPGSRTYAAAIMKEYWRVH